MTAFGLVMLGKLVLLVVFVYFLLLLQLYTWIQWLLSLFNLKKKSFVSFIKWVLDVHRPKLFHFGEVALAERRRHNDRLMWSYDLMFANYHKSKFAWRLTFSLDLFSCYLNSSAQRRLPDFTASTRLSYKFKMADAEHATVTRFSKCQSKMSIE